MPQDFRLNHFNYNICPECGAKTALIKFGDQHSNGQINETITFECGAEHHYSPNSQSIKTEQPCGWSAKCIERLEKELTAFNKIQKRIEEVFKDDKEKIQSYGINEISRKIDTTVWEINNAKHKTRGWRTR